ncbi:MAG: glycosyltransferase family 4 protein [bacterium]|nr:glycosyltransferase family 4 protein [bacterium]
MKILLTGYTYTRNNLFEVFDSYPEKQNLYFILPNNWKEKKGKVIYKPMEKEGFNIWHSRAFFFHSHYPIIGGLFKGWMPFFIFRFIKLRFTVGIDILYTTGEINHLGTMYNAIWAKLLGVKHICNCWDNVPYEQKDQGMKLRLKRWIVRTNLALSDGMLCGIHKAEEMMRRFDKDITIGTFLHAGFNENRFRPDLEPFFRKKLGLENKFIFLFVGALGYRKGIHLAIEALSQIRVHYPDTNFLVVGSGEYESELKEQVRCFNMGDVVSFIPWMDNKDLPSVFCSSDVFLYPSFPYKNWEEQFGYSIAEASLCGLPVISTHSGSIYEVLQDSKTGIMVEPNNAKALQQAMEIFINDRELAKKMGINGREFIINNFSNTIIAQKLYNLFRDVYSCSD